MSDTTNVPVTILLVDDEENILRALQRLLMDEEFEILTASSGEQGLEVLRKAVNVGLIISDQRMPGMNGAEFLSHSRELAPNALRILLTGYSDITATIDAINIGGAYRYISKPWDDGELVQTIRDAVRQYALLAENERLNRIVQQQNEELSEWNRNLKSRVLEQTTAIRQKNDELHASLQRVRDNYTAIIAAFSGLVEMRGKQRHQHARNVTDLSVNAAREMGISGTELEMIRTASLLHDIGEIGIPDRILLRAPETLNAEDLRLYQQHPVRGQMAIDTIEDLRPAGVLIRHHHENIDGSGFPDRLAGDAIPLGARIISFADRIDKAAEASSGDISEQVLAKIAFIVGKQLDPTLQGIFRKVVKYTYFTLTETTREQVELEITPNELRAGMVLARNVYSGSGLLLLHEGSTLDATQADSVRRYYMLDPPKHGIFVFVAI